ncbi:patatin-like phospholipase [Chthoniobacter flavus]|uniref:patatin-like phospholipase family protein n=1 Tax=Chthoniobacter flavus TaxID=191863 RepID=UPI0010436EDD|nr:patatin-like phospholipase family protein [Chthoniobacter flavus]TCO92011.1 patatin-like phospholipase [Chthoniobacter flavus]
MVTAPNPPEAKPAPSAADASSTTPGIYRVVSFPGAGLDTVLQMGVIHALLVTRRKAPDMVAGISVGAITAAALAEVFHASAGVGASVEDDEEVRVARFNELLEGFRNAPSTVLKSFFPDPLETNAAHALKPVELPRHFKEERDSRQESVAGRTGLIRLFNRLIRLRVSVKVFAQLSRVLMGWRAVSEAPWSRRWFIRSRLVVRLWWIVARNILSLSMPTSLLVKVGLSAILGVNGRAQSKGVEAGDIMFDRWFLLRQFWDYASRLFLGVVPLLLLLAIVPALLFLALSAWSAIPLIPHVSIDGGVLFLLVLICVVALVAWLSLLSRKTAFGDLLKHYQIFAELGDSYALKEALVQNFDPSYYGEFRFDANVRRALKQEKPLPGGCANKKPLKAYAHDVPRQRGIRVVPLAANLRTGKLEAIPAGTSIVDALMCACAAVPFFRAQTVKNGAESTTFIDGTSVSNDPIVPLFEEACKIPSNPAEPRRDRLRIISVPLLPLRQDKDSERREPYAGLVEVMLRAKRLLRFQDMLADKGLIDRINRVLNGRPATICDENCEPETFLPTKVRLVAPDNLPDLGLRLMHAGSAGERRKLIDSAVADGCRAMMERLVTDALPDTRTLEERRFFLEPDEEMPDEWPHRDESNTSALREAVESLRKSANTVTGSDGREYVSCRKLIAAWGGMKPLPGGDPVDAAHPHPGPGISEVCRCCITRHQRAGEKGGQEEEFRQHVRLPRSTPTPFRSDPKPVEVKKGPAVVFLFSGGVFRGVFQVGFSNAMSELGIQPDVVAGASVGTIIGALTGRVFERPAGQELVDRQRQTRRLAATFLTIDRFVLTDRFADFIRRFSIRAAAANFSPRDLDLVFRRYEKDSTFTFGRRARRVFSGVERLFHLSPFEMLQLAQIIRAGHWQAAAKQIKRLIQEMVDRYGVGLELLGPEPLQQLIDGFVFDRKTDPGARLDHFGFPLIGTTTNFTDGRLEILRHTSPWDPRFTQSLLAGSAFPMVFRPRWSWEVYRRPDHVAQYADGGIMDNLPLGAVVEYLWGKDSASRYERRPEVPHLILTATLEPEKADWSGKEDLEKLCWTEISARAKQLRYNGKIDKFQRGQRDIRRIIKQRAAEGDPDVSSPDLPLNLDVLAVKPQWLCGTFAFHPMLGFSRKRQTESIAHGCASTICAVADHFDPENTAHAINVDLLRNWARGRGIALDQLPERSSTADHGALRYGPAELSAAEQEEGACWFRRANPETGQRPVCPFHPRSSACGEGEELGDELHKIYLACGRRKTHQARGG